MTKSCLQNEMRQLVNIFNVRLQLEFQISWNTEKYGTHQGSYCVKYFNKYLVLSFLEDSLMGLPVLVVWFGFL